MSISTISAIPAKSSSSNESSQASSPYSSASILTLPSLELDEDGNLVEKGKAYTLYTAAEPLTLPTISSSISPHTEYSNVGFPMDPSLPKFTTTKTRNIPDENVAIPEGNDMLSQANSGNRIHHPHPSGFPSASTYPSFRTPQTESTQKINAFSEAQFEYLLQNDRGLCAQCSNPVSVAKRKAPQRDVRRLSSRQTRHFGLHGESENMIDVAEMASMDECAAVVVFLREIRKCRREMLFSLKNKSFDRAPARFYDVSDGLGALRQSLPRSRRLASVTHFDVDQLRLPTMKTIGTNDTRVRTWNGTFASKASTVHPVTLPTVSTLPVTEPTDISVSVDGGEVAEPKPKEASLTSATVGEAKRQSVLQNEMDEDETKGSKHEETSPTSATDVAARTHPVILYEGEVVDEYEIPERLPDNIIPTLGTNTETTMPSASNDDIAIAEEEPENKKNITGLSFELPALSELDPGFDMHLIEENRPATPPERSKKKFAILSMNSFRERLEHFFADLPTPLRRQTERPEAKSHASELQPNEEGVAVTKFRKQAERPEDKPHASELQPNEEGVAVTNFRKQAERPEDKPHASGLQPNEEGEGRKQTDNSVGINSLEQNAPATDQGTRPFPKSKRERKLLRKIRKYLCLS